MLEARAVTPERKKKVVEQLLQLWLSVPGLRLGQLVHNAAVHGAGRDDSFYIEDDDLITAMRTLVEKSDG